LDAGMKGAVASALGLCIALAVPASLRAKGETIRITITGADLVAPIEITDIAILRAFNVWSGPGVFHALGGFQNRTEETEGFVIDWASGFVERPRGLQHYEVAFYVSSSPQPVYVVVYEPDASAERGYVYLPGTADESYPVNTKAIFRGHGFEGHWFRATRAWQQAVAPLITRGR
jgi:hypothetical protein